MGRLVLTGSDEREALNFLYAHNGTHLLIDSTEIGKYGAFSSIGSNADYDRYSWIVPSVLDTTQTYETNNETYYIYPVGVATDDDIIVPAEGKEVLLPRKKTAVMGVGLKENTKGEMLQPIVFLSYNQQQYQMPLRYVHINGKSYDFKSGLDAGIFIYPKLDYTNNQLSVDEKGAAFYLSERTVHSAIARLYLFDEPSSYFKLVHTEPNLIISDLKNQGVNLGDFVYYNGFQGPIKIWEISYPSDIKLNEDYLSTEYPVEFQSVIAGEY
jgi:hypothetical protein